VKVGGVSPLQLKKLIMKRASNGKYVRKIRPTKEGNKKQYAAIDSLFALSFFNVFITHPSIIDMV